MKFLLRHQGKLVIVVVIVAVGALIGHQQIERIIVPKHTSPTVEAPKPKPHKKGVDVSTGKTQPPSSQPGPAPSGGGAPQENPPANPPKPPDAVGQVCGVSGNLGVQVPLVC